MGGSKTDPGIFINWSLRLGTTSSTCITFDKFWPLSRDLAFDIRTLELWVVNEVLLKKRNVPKRDFYSTVVMWNRLGKHKAKTREQEYLLEDNRECSFQNMGFRNNSPNRSPVVHETEKRYFEPSHTSLTGTNPLDEELLLAIKNRLAGVPPVPRAFTLKPETSGERYDNIHIMEPQPQTYLGNSEPNQPKKVPTPVATQVDDSMITELKHQGTSTSNVKVASAFTQSTLEKHVDEATHSRQSSRANGGFQRLPHLERLHKITTSKAQCSSNTEQHANVPRIRQCSSRMQRVDEEFQRSSHLEQNPYNKESTKKIIQTDDGNQQRTSSPQRNSFMNHQRLNVQPQTASPTQHNDTSADRIIGTVLQQGLPEVPHYYQDPSATLLPSNLTGHPSITSGRPSESRGLRSNQDLAGSGSLHGSNQRKGAAAPYQGLQPQQPSDSGVGMVESHRSTPPKVTLDPSYGRRSMNSSWGQLPQNRATGEPHYSQNGNNENRLNSPSRIMLDPVSGPSIYTDQSVQPPLNGPDGPTLLAMAAKGRSNLQKCRCGSKELNLVCCCKRSVVKEAECVRLLEKECRCAKEESNDFSKGKKRKKEKERKKKDKEAKAEEKRRKKEEKERQKREKMETKAREKESRKKRKEKKKNKKSKTDRKFTGLCSCCKCHGGGESSAVARSETSISLTLEEKCKKESKRETKRREKKKKKKEQCDERPFRSCECPQLPKPYNYNSNNCRMAPTPGSCNHPESPCPALMECSSSSMAVPVVYSKDNCGDPVCPRVRRAQKNCICYSAKMPNPCIEGIDPCDRLYANMALIEQIGPDTRNSNQQGREQRRPSRSRNISGPRISSVSGNAMNSLIASRADAEEDGTQYGDITAAPAIILPNQTGRGDAVEPPGRCHDDQRFPSTSRCNVNNVLIDLSKRGRENSSNKRYVPPCVLYLDCTKVKDLCVIIKDKYEDPS